MERKPEHYPKWLRDLLYDETIMSRLQLGWGSDLERNYNTLQCLLSRRRIDARDALIFDMCIEHERDIIQQQAINKAFREHIMHLEDRVGVLQSKLRGIGDEE